MVCLKHLMVSDSGEEHGELIGTYQDSSNLNPIFLRAHMIVTFNGPDEERLDEICSQSMAPGLDDGGTSRTRGSRGHKRE